MNDMNKVASACARAYLNDPAITKEAGGRAKLIGTGIGLLGLAGGWAYHQNQLRNMYRKGNLDLMAELRPLIVGLRGQQGAYALPQGTGFA